MKAFLAYLPFNTAEKRSITMLEQKINTLRDKKAIKLLTGFFDGNIYPAVYAVLALVCSFVGFELIFFTVTAAIIVATTLFCRDTKSTFVPLVLAVYAVSQRHTPQPPYNSDYLYSTAFLVAVGCLLAVVLAVMIFRLIAYKGTGNVFRTRTKARWGLFALGAALLLNGVFYGDYTIKNLFGGIALALSFVWFYIYFYNTLEWKEDTAGYAARLLVLAGAVILLQLAEVYIFDGAVDGGSINKGALVLGWGMSNNIGGMLATFMPASFYLAYKSRCGIAYYIFGFAVFAGVILTLSRTSVLVASAVFLICIILLSIKGRHVRFIRIFNIALVAVLAVLAAVFADELARIFRYYLDRGLDDSGRFEIWENGVRNFLRAPVFGVGFYTPIAPDWSYNIENWLFPDMYHNTIIQLLASCGVFGVLAYLFHIVQGCFLVFKRPTAERIFYFFVILVLSGISMGDNHLFHVFPALVYSALIALCEKDSEFCEGKETSVSGEKNDKVVKPEGENETSL